MKESRKMIKMSLFPALGISHWAALALLVGAVAGCGKKPALTPPGNHGAGPMGPPGAMGPVEVGVVTVATTKVNFTQDLLGRVSALRVAEVRARVNGIILKRFFTEGSDVKAADVLYQIDPAPYVATLNNAKGALAKAQANAEGARLKEQRNRKLLDTHVISQQDYDDAIATLHAYEADVMAGAAAVETAQINLSYTKVTAPVSGRIGASQVTEGAYVRETDATLLAKIQQLDGVYVDVTQSSYQLLRLKRQVASKEIETDDAGQATVKLLLEDGTEYAEKGALQFSDVTVDPSTSSVMLRSTFPNPGGELLPGMFVRARLAAGQKHDAILAPQLAVTRNQKGQPLAFVVGADGTAELRVLDATTTVGNQWLVRSGLKVGDQLIVSNLQQVRAGTPVKATPAYLTAMPTPQPRVN
jgi:membrane fusion protein (multidrug efflux system)